MMLLLLVLPLLPLTLDVLVQQTVSAASVGTTVELLDTITAEKFNFEEEFDEGVQDRTTTTTTTTTTVNRKRIKLQEAYFQILYYLDVKRDQAVRNGNSQDFDEDYSRDDREAYIDYVEVILRGSVD